MTAQQNDPYLDAGMKGFIVNTAKKEFWKVASYYEFADLVQDGYLCYYRCRAAYIGKQKFDCFGKPCRFLPKTNPDRIAQRHFMALVGRAFYNHISTLATKRMRVHEQPLAHLDFKSHGEWTSDDHAQTWDKLLPPQLEEASIYTLLVNAPAEIKQLAQLLVRDGLDLLKFERKRVHRRLLRETTNEFYCRLLGVDATKRNLVEELKAYFR